MAQIDEMISSASTSRRIIGASSTQTAVRSRLAHVTGTQQSSTAAASTYSAATMATTESMTSIDIASRQAPGSSLSR